ncbi:MAG TPA: 6-phosphogluconolactonase [Victivallales bacterium]|nr:6-phosphogluconolactonase [Victivallales bacterium]HRR06559.1 6-phosphogluconolactonase [Victivallales bacterium]HRR28589.1 6-phosphogluconolactonase [Victivallales bacterium]HRU02280.1 6-phosphogluconolactonase [Victivallales bacterium]
MWEIRKFKNIEMMSKFAIDFFLAEFYYFSKDMDFFYIVIPGGKTPEHLFFSFSKEQNIKWEKVKLFWTDERFVPESDNYNNFSMARKNLIENIKIPPENIFKIDTNFKTAKEAAQNYDLKIKRLFNGNPHFNISFIGMGTDGHIASIFPSSPALFESKKYAVDVIPPQYANPQIERITLTIPALSSSDTIILMISGQKKLDTFLESTKFSNPNPKYPLSFISKVKRKLCFVSE